nr:MAG TPA: hypothetical protein [Caudoviricetes sp.]
MEKAVLKIPYDEQIVSFMPLDICVHYDSEITG